MDEAIKLAIEKGGYVTGFMHDRMAAVDPLGAPEVYLLDPLFWQAFVVAVGRHKSTWKFHAHRYLDARFAGREGKFWTDLIKNI